MKRPANKICPVCQRKTLAPEGGPNHWRFPPKKLCYSCINLLHGNISDIKTNKKILVKSVKQSEAIFPLYIFDLDMNQIVGKFNDFESVRKELKELEETFPTFKFKVVDTKYHDFTDFFNI